MTISEARGHIGCRVSMRQFADVRPEFGVITSVTDQGIFVRYDGEEHATWTLPDLLTLMPERNKRPAT